MDILIRAKRERVEHKFEKNLLKEYGGEMPDGIYCYWSGCYPKQDVISNKVMFTDGKDVFAEGTIIGVDVDGLEFSPLKEVSYPQPKQAPTRGFTYVE